MFILYRLTNQFMQQVNSDKAYLELFRSRMLVDSCFGAESRTEAIAALKQLLNHGHLVAAARVDCTLENLYELTNTIHQNWTLNPQVTVLNPACMLSSTSIGDVFSDSDGVLYVVSDSDFIRLDS